MTVKKIDWDKNKVKALRSHMGMTQSEMAGEMGIRQQTVSEWETGMYKPRGSSSRLLTIIAERADFKYEP
jgi:DNA-binding transcriptional regulator YiaG